MNEDLKKQFRDFFEYLGEALDISESQYETAVQHYKAVGEWLNKEDSPIAQYEPQIYSQGSFRLGTMIKPIYDVDQFDIDLVCELKALKKEKVSQKELKDMIGNRLKENERYRKILKEGRRCWTLQYADSTRFHMDILPAIPDENKEFEIDSDLKNTAILITDKKLFNWQRSNPIGYAEWFKKRMIVRFEEIRKFLAKSKEKDIEDVPEYKIKTPLQRAIQIFKRHRDVMFADDKENKPISIIITTLAAHAYNNEADLLDTLINIIEEMPNYIQNRNGINWIPNPVNPAENFAESWHEYPEKKKAFWSWLEQLKTDLDSAFSSKNLKFMVEKLKPRFGDRIVNKAYVKVATLCGMSIDSTSSETSSSIIISNPNKPWGGNIE